MAAGIVAAGALVWWDGSTRLVWFGLLAGAPLLGLGMVRVLREVRHA